MASRKADKEAARQRRLEQESAAQAAAQRKQRLTIAGSLLIVVIAVAVVLVIVLGGSSSSTGNSKAATNIHSKKAETSASSVDTLLKGIPQHGTTLGNPKAPVTFTEYGDLQCPICKEFSEGAEKQLISNEVKSGKVKLVYKSFETATANGPDANQWSNQQSAAYAAGAQGKAWNYILLFYKDQGTEDTNYVNTAYLTGLAKQIPGLNYQKWNTDRFNPAYGNLVAQENKTAAGLSFQGQAGTPALVATGPKSQTKPISGNYPYSYVQSMIKSVS
ncbi:MAG: thioredoxin domain-containing protein [Solirubrobacteraceae bacterium]